MAERETTYRIYEDADYHFEVGHDRDGLGTIEVRYYEGWKLHSSVSFSKAEGALIGESLLELAEG